MAPKKKGNKRQEEDWEADLGESAPAVEAPTEEAQEEDNEEAPVGGLMAALRKNKAKKAKKNKNNDFVEGEDPTPADDLASKQPEEGNFDDDDVFAGKKTKPIKDIVKPEPAAEEPEAGEFRVKSKKEKEREKKEKEKQRKKEQVGSCN
jgi:translation initiation factor 5B